MTEYSQENFHEFVVLCLYCLFAYLFASFSSKQKVLISSYSRFIFHCENSIYNLCYVLACNTVGLIIQAPN